MNLTPGFPLISKLGRERESQEFYFDCFVYVRIFHLGGQTEQGAVDYQTVPLIITMTP